MMYCIKSDNRKSLEPGLFPKCNYGFYILGYLYYLENFYIHNLLPFAKFFVVVYMTIYYYVPVKDQKAMELP